MCIRDSHRLKWQNWIRVSGHKGSVEQHSKHRQADPLICIRTPAAGEDTLGASAPCEPSLTDHITALPAHFRSRRSASKRRCSSALYAHKFVCPRTPTTRPSQHRPHNDLRGERLCVDRWAAHGSEPASSSAGSFSSAASLSPVPSTSCGDGSPLSPWRIRRTSRRSVLVS